MRAFPADYKSALPASANYKWVRLLCANLSKVVEDAWDCWLVLLQLCCWLVRP